MKKMFYNMAKRCSKNYKTFIVKRLCISKNNTFISKFVNLYFFTEIAICILI